MSRWRFTISVSDKGIADFLASQENVSEYLRRLVESNMGGDATSPAATIHDDGILPQILDELRGLREDLGRLRIAAATEEASTRRTPAGLSRQADKFREGKR